MKTLKAVILLSKTYFPQHPKAGKPTYFAEKILAGQINKPGITIIENGKEKVIKGQKKHTCRSNYNYWAKKIARLKETGGVLSVRQWIDKPYKQPGQEAIGDIPAEIAGVQKLELCRKKVETCDELVNVGFYYYEWSAKVEGFDTPIELIAENDGLTLENFKAWFLPAFEKANSDVLDFAIIHFSKFRY